MALLDDIIDAPGQRPAFTAGRIAVETLDGTTVAESRDLPALFAGHGLNTPWGPLHRACFNGYAMWLYLNSPFVLAMPGVAVREIGPWREGGEEWRVLRGFFPAAQLIGEYAEVQGIRVPARRRAYVRGPDHKPVEDLLMVAIDLSDATLY